MDYDGRFKRLSDAPGIVLINNYKCGFSSSNQLRYSEVTQIDDQDTIILFYRNIFLRSISVFINWCITDDRYRTGKDWLFDNLKYKLDQDRYQHFLDLLHAGRIVDAFRFYVDILDLVIEMNNHTLPQVAIFEYYGFIRIDHFVELENCREFLRLTKLGFPYEFNNKSKIETKQSLLKCLNHSKRLQNRLLDLYSKDIEYFREHGIDVASIRVLE